MILLLLCLQLQVPPCTNTKPCNCTHCTQMPFLEHILSRDLAFDLLGNERVDPTLLYNFENIECHGLFYSQRESWTKKNAALLFCKRKSVVGDGGGERGR